MLVDTHCHIHEVDYPLDKDEVIIRAREAGVEKIICVGTNTASSQQALAFAAPHSGVYASAGIHPHDSKNGWIDIENIVDGSGQQTDKLVAIGEIGLDYFYTNSPRQFQTTALEAQIQLASDHDLPIIFHVRQAFDDFWPIFDNFHDLRGVLHSFSDSKQNAEKGLARGLYIGVNGISTFTKDTAQQTMFAELPLERLLLETDAPFLTPVPNRGKVNEPAFVRSVAGHQATIRGVSFDTIAKVTTANANTLFTL